MEVIVSQDNKKIKNLSKLLIKKYRDSKGMFLVNGQHLVEEAYKKGILVEVIKTEDCDLNFDVATTYVSYDVLKKLTNVETPQRIVGLCKKIEEKEYGNKILLLDDIQDPGNLGTIIRSSVAFSVDTIVLSNNSVDLYNDKVIRSSEGMLFHINVIRSDIMELINELKYDGYKIYGTKVDGGNNIKNVKVNDKYALIMGNEGNGVKKEILDMCDEYLYIPMNSKCESLNVGVATSIILYEIN